MSVLHTHDKWIQEIRQVKAGEQPFRRVKKKKKKKKNRGALLTFNR